MYVFEDSEGVTLRVVYNTGLFSEATIDHLLDAYEELLAQIVADPDAAMSSYTIGSARGRAVLPDPRAPLTSVPAANVAAAVVETATRVPGQVAVCQGAASISYGELERRSAALADRLIAGGFGPESVAAVTARRKPELIVALLGVLRAGGAFVLVDPGQPAARSIDGLEALQPRIWIAIDGEPALPDELQQYVDQLPIANRLQLGDGGHLTGDGVRPGAAEIAPSIAADSLAYVAFTSGSTGRPKGIAGEHGPLAHFIAWHRDTFAFSTTDRFSMLSGLLHDPLLRDVFTPLTVGATLVVPSAEDLASPAGIADWLSAEQITVAHLTPPMIRFIAQAERQSSRPLTLRQVFCGGDALRWDDVARLAAMAPDARVVNFYGTTETPQAMGYHAVGDARSAAAAHEDEASALVPVGRGIDGVQLLVVGNGRQCGVGEPGEIWIRTANLARGYLDAQQTSERFILNPFTGLAGDRIYRTGDRGRYRPDGTVQFLGRGDDQVKIRGFRVEPAEIERVLRQQPLVDDALVMARDSSTQGLQLVAYVVCPGAAASIAELRSALVHRLPEYMVPAHIVPVESLPLTKNGKVDRAALPLPPDERPVGVSTQYTAPSTPVERLIAGIWTDVLGWREVGIYDNFFELGGHSLLATRLVSRLRAAIGVEIPLRALFESPTVSGLARHVATLQWALGAAAEHDPTMTEVEL
jgi:amino acid adenylation domain-containing protein